MGNKIILKDIYVGETPPDSQDVLWLDPYTMQIAVYENSDANWITIMHITKMNLFNVLAVKRADMNLRTNSDNDVTYLSAPPPSILPSGDLPGVVG